MPNANPKADYPLYGTWLKLKPEEKELLRTNPIKSADTKFIYDGVSYSGADIKVVVHMYDNGGMIDSKIAQRVDQITQAMKDTVAEILVAQRSKAIMDGESAAFRAAHRNEREALITKIKQLEAQLETLNAEKNDTQKDQISTKVLAELQTLSVSTHREKFPVRSLGAVHPKNFCLPETQKVLVRDKGYVSIKDIMPGDWAHSGPDVFSRVVGSYNQGNKVCYEIKLANGYDFRASFDHPVMTDQGWVWAGDLEPGDPVAVCAKSPVSDKDLNIPDWILIMTAYLLGDGGIHRYEKDNGGFEHRLQLSIATTELDFIGRETEEILKEAKIPFRDNLAEDSECIDRVISVCQEGYAITDWRQRKYNELHYSVLDNNLYDTYSHTKFIPPRWLGNLSQRQIKLFLSRLFSTDGGYAISENDKDIEAFYSSVSEQLIDGIRLMLSQIGILALKQKESKVGKVGGRPGIISRHDSYKLVISEAKSLYKFAIIVGIFGKQYKILPWLPVLKRRIRNLVLPLTMEELSARVTNIYRQRGLFRTKDCLLKTFKARFNLNNPQLPLTPCRALRVIDEINDPELTQLVESTVETTILKDNTFIYCNILSTEPIGELPVYDLSIEEKETFISNFIYLHNTRGPRTIAGSMVFAVFNQHVLFELLRSYPGDTDKDKPSSAAGLIDQLPPFDITIAFANELGGVARMAILGCEFVNEGQTMSIEDIFLENVAQYVARDIDPMRSVSQRMVDENNRLTVQEMGLSASSLLGEPDYLKYKEKLNPFERYARRTNPFI